MDSGAYYSSAQGAYADSNSSTSTSDGRARASQTKKKGSSHGSYTEQASGCPVCSANGYTPYRSPPLPGDFGYASSNCQSCGYPNSSPDTYTDFGSTKSSGYYNTDSQPYQYSSDVVPYPHGALSETGTSDYETLIYVNKTGQDSTVRVGVKLSADEGEQPYTIDQQVGI